MYYSKEICNATSSRQLAITNIKDGDVLYVVGDVKSNNTNKLKEIGSKYFKKVFLISNYKEINKKISLMKTRSMLQLEQVLHQF